MERYFLIFLGVVRDLGREKWEDSLLVLLYPLRFAGGKRKSRLTPVKNIPKYPNSMCTPIGKLIEEGGSSEHANEAALVVWSAKSERVVREVTFSQASWSEQCRKVSFLDDRKHSARVRTFCKNYTRPLEKCYVRWSHVDGICVGLCCCLCVLLLWGSWQ